MEKQTDHKSPQIKHPGGRTSAVQAQPDKKTGNKSVFAGKRSPLRGGKSRRDQGGKKNEIRDEFEQRIIDIARVTRVMAGGKRMRFRACVAVGNKKGKIAVGLAKGADVTLAVTKAVNRAKKDVFEVSIVNETIPHEIFRKLGAAKVLLKPARRGKGVIAGGAMRTVLELAGIKNITCKNLGTNNKVNITKCTIEALKNLKIIEKKKPGGISGSKPQPAALKETAKPSEPVIS